MKGYPYLVAGSHGFRFFLGEKHYQIPENPETVHHDNHGTFITGTMDYLENVIDRLPESDSRKQLLAGVLFNYRNYNLSTRKKIMGILNITEDSFSDGGHFYEPDKAVEKGLEMSVEGADVIDIGGESTRPGSDSIPLDEEIKRIEPVISRLNKQVKSELSIDTRKPEVAELAFSHGATWLNDTSGLSDEHMVEAAVKQDVKVVIMHMKDTPKTMQDNPSYGHMPAEISAFLVNRIVSALKAGIPAEKIYVDPGIGFGKTPQANFWMIRHLDFLWGLGHPICLGTSRKSFLGSVIESAPRERLTATLAVNTEAYRKGTHLFRVHDVKPHRELLDILGALDDA